MGTTQIVISFGEGNMSRLGKWRSKVGYPPERTNDQFIRDQIMAILDVEVPA